MGSWVQGHTLQLEDHHWPIYDLVLVQVKDAWRIQLQQLWLEVFKILKLQQQQQQQQQRQQQQQQQQPNICQYNTDGWIKLMKYKSQSNEIQYCSCQIQPMLNTSTTQNSNRARVAH